MTFSELSDEVSVTIILSLGEAFWENQWSDTSSEVLKILKKKSLQWSYKIKWQSKSFSIISSYIWE